MWQARIRAEAQEALFQWVLTLESLWIQHELPLDIRRYLFRMMVPVAPKGDPDLLKQGYITVEPPKISYYATRWYRVPTGGFSNFHTVMVVRNRLVPVCRLCLKPTKWIMCLDCNAAYTATLKK